VAWIKTACVKLVGVERLILRFTRHLLQLYDRLLQSYVALDTLAALGRRAEPAMKLRALLGITGAVAATVALPVSAQAVSAQAVSAQAVSAQAAVHPHCTGYTYSHSVSTRQITVSETLDCASEQHTDALSLWVYVPISHSWTEAAGTTYSQQGLTETVTYVCQGNAANSWDLQEGYTSTIVPDNCGPVQP
jgi:hypothetical protein